MIPIRLTLEGLYSYQQAQQIDFDRLTQAELFGIFGATGSGKSSILEAITFALYGRTERLSAREPGGTAYHMMNLKSARLWIDFEFVNGQTEADRFRFTVEARRQKKNFESIKPFKREAYQWKGEGWIPLEQSDAATITGLSYENFRRTIIIPQGKFQEFIQLKNTDRNRMLQELFNLNRFNLGTSVKRLAIRNATQIETHTALLNQYTAVTKEAMEEVAKAQQALTEQKQALETTLSQKRKQQSLEERLRQRTQELSQFLTKLKELEGALPQEEARKARLERYIYCLKNFQELFVQQKDRHQKLESIQEALEHKAQTVTDLRQAQEKEEKVFAGFEASYLNREKLLQEADELAQVRKLKAEYGNIQALVERRDKGARMLASVKQELTELDVAEKDLQTQKEAWQKEMPDTSALLALKDWYAQFKSLNQSLAHAQTQLEATENAIGQAIGEKKELLDATSLDQRQHDLPIGQLLSLLEESRQRLEAQREQQDTALREHQLAAQLAKMTDSLQPGQACPLCGSLDHPAPHHQQLVPGKIARAEAALRETRQRYDQLQQQLPALQRLHTQAQELGQHRKLHRTAVLEIQTALDRHTGTFVWEGIQPDDEGVLEQREKRGLQLRQQIEAAEVQLKSIQAQRQEALGKQETYREHLDQMREKISAMQGGYQQQVEGLKLVNFEQVRTHTDQQLSDEEQQFRQAYEEVAQSYKQYREQLKERQARIDALGGEIKVQQEQVRKMRAELASLSQTLDQTLAKSDIPDLRTVQEVLASALNIEAERSAAEAFQRRLTETRTSVSDLQSELGEQVFDEAGYGILLREIAALEAQQAELTQQIGGKVESLRRLEEQWAEKRKLEKEALALAERADNLRIFENLFRGNGFVNYISTAFLENLCAAANARFMKLANNSLRLEVDGDNNFLVADLLNGGRRRSIKTLSGGQTFQAALSLALALSEQVQQQAQARQNFFFLDEGFGSQDRRSLLTIFQTLKSLRKENRIVGVISHVEELQQEIETHLQIVNDPELGSQVTNSWS